MLVAATSTTSLIGGHNNRTTTTPEELTPPSSTQKMLETSSSSSSVVNQRRSSSPQSPIAIRSLCVRISRDTNGFKALLNKYPTNGNETTTGQLDGHKLAQTPIYTINPTITHRCPQILDINGRDSLVDDMCVFDPINPVAQTPNVLKGCQSIKTPKFKCTTLKHRKFTLRINKTSSLLRLKLLKQSRPSAFCFLGTILEPTIITSNCQQKRAGKHKVPRSTEEANTNYEPQTKRSSLGGQITNRKVNRRGSSNYRNKTLDIQELQMSITRPLTRSFLRQISNKRMKD